MIYNFLVYAEANKPAYNYAVNGAHNTTPKQAIIINETTSVPAKYIDRNDITLQIIGRAENPVAAKQMLDDFYTIVDRYWDVVLPENTVNFIVYPAIKAYQMAPIQRVTWFGYDENGLAQYLFNLQIITK